MTRLPLLALLPLPAAAFAQTGSPPPAPISPLPAPFQRIGGAFAFPVSTTPQTYVIAEPAGATSYRGVNPCSVDIVISTVAPTASPVTTQPVTFNGQTVPNVQIVTSTTTNVDQFMGTMFLGRTSEALGSTLNPMGGPVRYVSIMALSAPATACAFRLGYGKGG